MFTRKFSLAKAAFLLLAVVLSACGGTDNPSVEVSAVASFTQNFEDQTVTVELTVIPPPGAQVEIRKDPYVVVELNNYPKGFMSLSDEGTYEPDRYSHNVTIDGYISRGTFNEKFNLGEITTIWVVLGESNLVCAKVTPDWRSSGIPNPSSFTLTCELPLK